MDDKPDHFERSLSQCVSGGYSDCQRAEWREPSRFVVSQTQRRALVVGSLALVRLFQGLGEFVVDFGGIGYSNSRHLDYPTDPQLR